MLLLEVTSRSPARRSASRTQYFQQGQPRPRSKPVDFFGGIVSVEVRGARREITKTLWQPRLVRASGSAPGPLSLETRQG